MKSNVKFYMVLSVFFLLITLVFLFFKVEINKEGLAESDTLVFIDTLIFESTADKEEQLVETEDTTFEVAREEITAIEDTVIYDTVTIEETISTSDSYLGCVTPAYDYTEEELDLLARLIFSEGGIESYETQLMIGSVVMNRVLSEDFYFPDTIREVIYQENQFSVTFLEMDGVIMIDRPADEEAKRAAYEVLTYGSVLPPDVQVFFHKSITTGWVSTREPYGTYDNTTFAYIYERSDK